MPRFLFRYVHLCVPLRSVLLCVLLWAVGSSTSVTAGAADSFLSTGAMSAARRGHTATRLADARVLVVGGLNETGTIGGAELYHPGTGVWNATGALATPRSGASAVLLQNGKVLVKGGRDTNGAALASAEIYDPASGEWTATGTMSAARRHHTATLLPDGKVLVAGGATDDAASLSLDTSELYDPRTGTWADGGRLSYGRSFHTASLVGGQVIVVGGTSGSSYNTVIELYNLDLRVWSILGSGPGTSDRARKFHTATVLPNFKVLVAGGTKDVPLATARLLVGFGVDTTGSLTGGRTGHTAAVLPGNRVLAAGGLNAAGAPTASAEIYQQSTGTWAPASSLVTARAGQTATVLAGGAILLTGGYDAAGALASCEIYAAQPTQWLDTASMIGGRSQHTSTLLPSGKVLVTGGFGRGQTIVGSAEMYDPLGDSWMTAGPFSPRAGHSATLLGDGRVMLTGGYTDTPGTNFTAATTLFDPNMGAWMGSGSLQTSRAFHAAVLLPGGKVLVAGGYRPPNYTPLASAELFDPGTGTWSAAASMAKTRHRPAAILLPNGKVLVLDRDEQTPESVPGTAELYDPGTNTWQPAASPLFPHVSHILTLLPNGRVFVAGRTDFYNPSATGKAEFYNPATDSWTAAAPMRTEGLVHSATLLMDGRVVVTGNYLNPWPGSEGSAEIYDPAADSWMLLRNLRTTFHRVAVLLDGRALFTGGDIEGYEASTIKTQAFDVFFASPPEARPVIATASFDAGKRLMLTGSGLTGSPETVPLVKLRRLDNGQTATLTPDPAFSWSGNAFTSLPANSFPQGPAMVTVYLDGVPGKSAFVNVPGPEISVVRQPSGAPEADGNVVDFGTVPPDGSAELSVRVNNTGSVDLSGMAVTISGAGASFFTLTSPPAASISSPSGTTTFTVRFASGSPGEKTAVLRLANNDADEGPYDLFLKGAGANTAPVISTLANQTIDEDGVTTALAFTVGDAETPEALTLSATSSNVNLITSSRIVFGGTGAGRTVILSPLADRSGEALITLTVSDGVVSTTSSFTLVVNPLNDPPTLSAIPSPIIVLEDSASRIVNLTGITAGSGEIQPLTVTAVSSNPAIIPAPLVTYNSGSSTGTLRFTALPNAFGSVIITVSVSDGPAEADTTTRSFTVTVTGINDPPSLAVIPAPATIPEDAGMQTLTLSGISAGPGEEGQPITITALSTNPGLIPHPVVEYSSPAATARLSYTPVANAFGIASITVTVRDGQTPNLMVSRTFSVTVSPVNDPPELAAIADRPSLPENAGLQTVEFGGVSAGGGENQTLTVTAASSHPTLVPHPLVTYISGAAGGQLQFTPASDMSGTAVITVTVRDGPTGISGTVSQSFTVRVLPLLRGEAPSVAEGNAGDTILKFRLFVGSPQTRPVNVNYNVEPGSAQAGSDYTAAAGTATIAAGETETYVNISITGDTEFEADETLSLVLSSPDGVLLDSSAALKATITNDDAQPQLSLSAGSVTESSSSGPYRVWVHATLTGPSLLPLTWSVMTRAGTAESGTDFTPLGPAVLTFAPGEISKWIAVAVTGNQGQGETDETFFVDFRAASGPANMVTSVCTVRQLAVQDFFSLGSGLYALRFPTGTDQSYVIEEAKSLAGPWINSSSVLLGSGSVVTQVVFSSTPHAFFRISAAPAAPGPAAVGP